MKGRKYWRMPFGNNKGVPRTDWESVTKDTTRQCLAYQLIYSRVQNGHDFTRGAVVHGNLDGEHRLDHSLTVSTFHGALVCVPSMRFWWVNQNQTFRQEIAGGYLWSPKQNVNGARNPFYDSMREVAPGDLILSFENTLIRAMGVARSYCFESPKPAEFGKAGPNWNQVGWRVQVEWTHLIKQIRPKDHIDLLRPFLPARYSPLQGNGNGVQSIYLTKVPEDLAKVLGALIGPEFEALASRGEDEQDQALFVAEDAPYVDEWEEHLERKIESDETIHSTDKAALIQARRGQGIFKQRVWQVERSCRITRVDNPAHLIASHCKPWRDSDDSERLNGENGLLLTPSIDHLFDRGFISFEDNGHLIISPVAHRPSLQRMGIPVDESVNVGGFSSGQRHFLEYHRNSVLLQSRS